MALTKTSKRMLGLAAATILAVAPQAVIAHSEDDYDHMGPMGFMWPQDREWDEEDGMSGPCGTDRGATDRTEFPIVNGALALEQKQQVFDVQISIALGQDITNDTDFQVILSSEQVQSLDFSHVCLDLPSLGLDDDSIDTAGTNATIQLRYVAEYIDPDHHHRRSSSSSSVKRHMPVNETFYACADVTLVREEAFTFDIPCFNATAEADDDHEHDDEDEDHEHSHEDEDDEDEDEDHEHSGLSGADIAGIVVGSVVGVAVIATVAWYFWRRDRREKQVAQHILETREDK